MPRLDAPALVRFDPALHAAHLAPLTRLLHEAYAPLAAKGMHYLASRQTEGKTRERLLEGSGWLLFLQGELAGTVSLYNGATKKVAADYYRRPGVWLFGQFGIHPRWQGRGLGAFAMDFLEEEARRLGARELACDTAETAHELIAMYRKRGYVVVSETEWPDVNYRSLILSKVLLED